MDRIRLNKDEKAVLRLLQSGVGNCPDTYPRHLFTACVNSLERKGLAKGAWATGHELEAARLTSEGAEYLALNPTLRNPIDWGKISIWVGIASAIIAAISLFVACRALMN